MPAVLYVYHGEDDFSLHEAVRVLETQVGSPEVREPNTHRLTAQGLTLGSLKPLTQAPPFLSDFRLVMVEGLLAAQTSDGGRPGGRKGSKEKADAWKDFDKLVLEMPPTTVLVLVDGKLEGRAGLLPRLVKFAQEQPKQAQVREFAPMRDADLSRWIRARGEARGVRLSPPAITLLVDLVGGNLWAMDGEIEKLALHAGDRTVTEDDVRLLVSQAREASIYVTIDAIIDGRIAQAAPLVQRLLNGGTSAQQLIALLQRSLHQLTLVKEGIDQGLPVNAIGQRINLYSEFVVRKLIDQARRLSWERLTAAYQCLVATDLALKTGEVEEQLGVELLVADLCALR